MEQAKGSASGRAVRGIEAAAFVLRHAFEAFAFAGGEGARRLLSALDAQSGEGIAPTRLEGAGLDAARAALGSALGGRRTALLASGPALVEVLPLLREMVRVGAPVVVVTPSHGDDVGATLPQPGFEDVVHVMHLPLGLLIAADATQVADFTLAALRAAADRGAPWVMAFDLAGVGLALAAARLPTVAQVRAWAEAVRPSPAPGGEGERASLLPEGDVERYRREVDRYAFALGSAMRDLERTLRRPVAPLITDGVRDAEIVLVSVGASARAAHHAVPHTHHRGGRRVGAAQVASMRPFPAADLVRLAWRAHAVVIHEAFPEPLGAGGALSDAVRASFADALTWHPAFTGIGRIPPVVTVLGREVSPDQWLAIVRMVEEAADPPRLLFAGARAGGAAEARIEVAMDERSRDQALELVVDWLARTGTTVSAHAYEPTRTGITVARAGGGPKVPPEVLVVCSEGHYAPTRIESLAPGSLVVFAGDFPDRVLAETMRVAAPRGVRVAHLGGHEAPVSASVALAAVLRAVVAHDAASEEALEAALRESGLPEPDAIIDWVRRVGRVLLAQLG